MALNIGFIGCGNMGSALARAVKASGKADEIFVFDFDKSKTEFLTKEIGAIVADSKEICENSKYVFIGVKPQVIADCFNEIKDYFNDDTVIVSMAAGVEIADIVKMSNHSKVIRIMPNLPVSVGRGVVLASSNDIDETEKNTFKEIMSESGVFDWLDEKYIDSAGAVSGCGPAYAYIFTQALADGAVLCGLPRDKALLYAAGMLSGAAEMVLKSEKHPEKLKDDVCSPGGTTIAGVKALEDGGFRSAVINSVVSAYKKTKELK